jgi:hypothetical protein
LIRPAALWVLLFAVYSATAVVPATAESQLSAGEARHIRVAEVMATDRRLDAGEPVAIGFPLLIAPAYAVGGVTGVQLFLAALAALAFTLAVSLARRVVPDPWATSAAAVLGLSPPALAYATGVYPDLTAGAVLVAAALLALRMRESSRVSPALGGACLLALLPWLAARYLLAAALVAVALVQWTAARSRRLGALVAAEIVAASVVAFAMVNNILYGGLTPHAAAAPGQPATGAASAADYLERLPRLVALWIDREDGLLRWAPVVALAFLGAFALWRSRVDRITRALPERRDAEAAAALALAICAGAVGVAALGAPVLAGPWFPGRHLVAALPAAAVLAAWGWRRAPRAGAAMAGLTLLASAWLVVDLARGAADGWARPDTSAPLGPALEVLPRYGVGSAWAAVAAALLGAAAAAVVGWEWRRWSRSRYPRAGTGRGVGSR